MFYRETSIAQRKFERKVSSGYLVVEAKLHSLGDQSPYFSVTAELWQSKGWYHNGQDGRMISCGCLHEEVTRAFPKLRPLVALHLSDESGAPMHCYENAWYWYRGADTRWTAEENFNVLADHLRVSVDSIPRGLCPEAFGAYVASLRSTWKEEALAALAFLNES